MQKYQAIVAYIGTQFSGFQSQPDGTAVQDHLERALRTILRVPKIRIRGASRTDRGVHAEKQVITFSAVAGLEPSRLWVQLNGVLPPDIRILSVSLAPADFSPLSASAKVYRYRVWVGRCYNPMVAPFVWQVRGPLDVEVLRQETQAAVGRHNFTSFCSHDSHALTKDRTLLAVEVDGRGPLINIWIQGEGFLKQMIRILVGTWVEAAIGKRAAGEMAWLLGQKNRALAGITAPAKGLSLVDIFYDGFLPPLSQTLHQADSGFSVAVGSPPDFVSNPVP